MNDDGRAVDRAAVIRQLARVAGIAAAGLVATLTVAAARGGFDHEIFRDAPEQPRAIQNFTRVGPFEGREGAGVRSQTYLRLRRLDRSAPWRVSLTARSAGGADATLIVTIDDKEVLRREVTPAWTDVSFEIPARNGRGAVVGFAPAPGRSVQPVVIGDVHFRTSSWLWLSREAMWASLVVSIGIGVLLASAGWSVYAIASGVVALAFQAMLITRGLGEGTYVPWTGEWGVAVAGLGAVGCWLLRRSSSARAWQAAVVIAALAVAVQGWVLRHPLVGYGDSLFHLHRLQAVQDGAYFFTSAAPGGEFPYPVALYVIAQPLAALVDDSRWLLRAIAIVAHGLAAVALFAAVARWRTADEALRAEIIFLAVPVGFHTFAVAYLTNSFGQSMSVIALAAAAAWPFDRRPWTGAAVLAVTAAVSFLTHLGTFMMLALCMAAFAAVAFLRPGERSRAMFVAASTAGAVVLSVALFYGWFGDTYRALWSRPRPAPMAADAEPPVMRREAHQTQYVPGLEALKVRLAAVPGYVERYYGWWLPPLAVAGWLAGRRRSRDPISSLTAGWLGAGAFFFVLGHISSIDIRYYLGAYPALALVGAQAGSGGRAARLAGAGLLAWGTLAAFAYWPAWLGMYP